MKFLSNLDLNKNQILNVALQNLAAHPSSPVSGQLYFNTADKVAYYYDAVTPEWVPMAGDIKGVTAGAGLTGGGTSGIVTLDINTDNITLEVVGDVVRIKDLGVSTGKLADAAVTTPKIADGNVTTVKIADSNVTTPKIADLNVTTAKINDLAVTTGKIADGAVTTVKLTDKNITFAKIQDVVNMRVLGNVSGSTGSVQEVVLINDPGLAGASGTNIPTAGAVVSYVSGLIAGLGNLEGSYAPAAPNAALPVASGGTKKGDYWYVTTAQSVGTAGTVVNIGDVIIANKDAASTTLVADWIFLESNRDQATNTVLGVVMIADATETIAGSNAVKAVTPASLNARTALETRTGLIELADQTEMNAGTDDTRAVTPKKFKDTRATETIVGTTELATQAEATAGTLDNVVITPLKLKGVLDGRTGGYAATIGDGVATSFVVTHSLNTLDVNTELVEVANGETVYTDVRRTNVNAVTVYFNVAPAASQYRIVIKK